MGISRKLVLLAGVVLWFGTASVWAQEDETPAQKQYREDYEVFMKIQAVKEPLKRADEYLKFIQERPQSQLVKDVSTRYLYYLDELVKQSNWNLVTSLSDRFIKVRPTVGETYYFSGQALDKLNKPEEAMTALAKCYIFTNPGSNKAKLYLDSIYKRLHQGKTDGLTEMIQKIRKEVGG